MVSPNQSNAYSNFGMKNAMIEITDQTIAQRDAFSSGNNLGANITASSLFSVMGNIPDDNTSRENHIKQIKDDIFAEFNTTSIAALLNPDFTEETLINFLSLDSSVSHLQNLNDRPNQFGPNIGTLRIDSSGQPETITNRLNNNSPTYRQGKGFGFTVGSNTYGSHIDTAGNTTFGNYLSRKYSFDGNLSIKKGESIDHDDLDYEN